MMRSSRTLSGRWPASARRSPAVGLFVLSAALVATALTGCESKDGVIDTAGAPPQVLSISVTPDVFVLDTLGGSSGTLTLQSAVSATVRDQIGGKAGAPQVIATISLAGSSTPLASVPLREGSHASGIRTFSATLPFSVSRSAIGALSLSVNAVSPGGLPGSTFIRQVILRRTNSRPTLSRLTAPDTVTLAPADSALIPMTIAASDSNGTDDIREVFFRSLDSSDPTRKFFLFDNGNPANGDATSGDGIYSIIVQLKDGPTVRKTYRFAFQAADGAGDTSLTTLHRLTVR